MGAVVGFIVGFLVGMISKPEKKIAIERESRAQRLFNLATKQENNRKKMKLLGKVLDKYPRSEWADKALEEVMKIKKGNPKI